MKIDTEVNMGNMDIGSLNVDLKKPKDFVKTNVGEITEECEQELSDQAKQIQKQEKKLAERMYFDNDRCYYFSIVFRTTEDRNKYLAEKGIKLKSDMFVFYEDVKDKL